MNFERFLDINIKDNNHFIVFNNNKILYESESKSFLLDGKFLDIDIENSVLVGIAKNNGINIYGLDITICRFYNVYGDCMPTEGSYRTVLPIFLEQYRNNETFTITGDGKQRRDFTHVDDIIDAMMKVVQLNKWGNVYELGRGKNYSIKQVVDMFPDPAWTYIDMIPGEARDTLCRSELARKKLKWKPKINLEDWIKEQL